jgi:hypothetical protein
MPAMQDSKSKSKSSNSVAENELDKAEKQFQAFEENIKDLTLDRMNAAPKEELEPEHKLSSNQIQKSKDIYLKPKKHINDGQKFNEKFREEWNFAKEYVQFIAGHNEIIGENIELWTHPFGGMGADFWEIPVNTPVWGPRYLAEQIRKRVYHRLVMKQNNIVSADGVGSYYGQMVADTTIARLTAEPVSTKKSVFMGASSF